VPIFTRIRDKSGTKYYGLKRLKTLKEILNKNEEIIGNFKLHRKYSTRELRKKRNDKINPENIEYIKTHIQDLPSQK